MLWLSSGRRSAGMGSGDDERLRERPVQTGGGGSMMVFREVQQAKGEGA